MPSGRTFTPPGVPFMSLNAAPIARRCVEHAVEVGRRQREVRLLFDMHPGDVALLHVEALVVADLDPAEIGAAHRVRHLGELQHLGVELHALIEVADEEGDVVEAIGSCRNDARKEDAGHAIIDQLHAEDEDHRIGEIVEERRRDPFDESDAHEHAGDRDRGEKRSQPSGSRR